jgi:hypothetical protein
VSPLRHYKAKPQTRLTIGFSDDQMLWLHQEASRRAIPVSDVIRRIIDELRGDSFIEPERRKQVLGAKPRKPSQSRI